MALFMDREGPSGSTAFNTLPIELNQAIARYLETDKDIANYSFICVKTHDAVNADRGSFWRAKFREKFALRADRRTNDELMDLYKNRRKQLRRGTGYDFFRGHRTREKDVAKVLRELIVESFQGPLEFDEHGQPRCKNQDQLAKFVLNSKLLLNDRRAPPASRHEPNEVQPLLAAVKLICSQFLFNLDGPNNVFGVEESQRVVYMATNAAPLYTGPKLTEVNMNWMLHCLQFFRNHMMNEDVASLYSAMEELTPGEKPSAWKEPLREGSYPLSSHWKGTYAFLDMPEIVKLRKLSADQAADAYFCDKNVDEGKIQSLQLDFMQGAQEQWPQKFESRLHSRRSTAPIPTHSRPDPAQKDIQFTGSGIDLEDDFNAIGWVNALPDQYGIPGWQRITFMKHFMDDFDSDDEDNLWAYEGVVLPGGRVILGRWWYASENVDFSRDYNGPFILWAVDEPEVLDEEDEDD